MSTVRHWTHYSLWCTLPIPRIERSWRLSGCTPSLLGAGFWFTSTVRMGVWRSIYIMMVIIQNLIPELCMLFRLSVDDYSPELCLCGRPRQTIMIVFPETISRLSALHLTSCMCVSPGQVKLGLTWQRRLQIALDVATGLVNICKNWALCSISISSRLTIQLVTSPIIWISTFS